MDDPDAKKPEPNEVEIIAFGDGAVVASDAKGNTSWVEVFRAGKYPQGEVPAEAVAKVAASYSPTVHDAPVTLDHAEKGPAYGWIAGLKDFGGRLFARFRDLVPEFRELAKTCFPKRSIELYPPASSPTGDWYLKAVSFLGAHPPAVKGMPDAAFAEGARAGVNYTYEEWTPMADDKKPSAAVDTAQFAELQAKVVKLEELQAKVVMLEADNKKLGEANAKLADDVVAERSARLLQDEIAFCEALSKDGKLVPALAKGLPELLVMLCALPEAAVVKFAEGDKEVAKQPYRFMKDWLGSLTKLVHFGEVAGGDGEPPATKAHAAWAEEDVVDLDLDAKAKAYQEEQRKTGTAITYQEALLSVAKL